MPLPTSSDLHVNALLTNLSVAFDQADENFVADKVFPAVSVPKQSDRYAEYDRSYFFRTEMQKRAQETEAAVAGYAVSTTASYFCDVWALAKAIDDQQRANADTVFNLEQDATRFLTLQHKIRREKQWVSSFFGTGKWTGSTTGGDITPSPLWSAGSSVPFKNIREQMFSVQSKTGIMPNTLVLGADVWQILADHVDLVDRIKGGANTSNPAVGMLEQLAMVLGLQRVMVAMSVENTAKEGATGTYARVAGAKNALLCYAAPNPGLLTPSAGYVFNWSGLVGSQNGQRILTYQKPPHLDMVEIEAAYDMKLVSPVLGAFFSAAVS